MQTPDIVDQPPSERDRLADRCDRRRPFIGALAATAFTGAIRQLATVRAPSRPARLGQRHGSVSQRGTADGKPVQGGTRGLHGRACRAAVIR